MPEVFRTSEEKNIPAYLSSLMPELLIKNPSLFSDRGFIIKNWQDERYSNWLTFDGLVDQNGNKKIILGEIQGLLTNNPAEISDIPVRILKPAEPLFPGMNSKFRAVYLKDNLWQSASIDPVIYSYEWHLLKTDENDFPLAIKFLGNGPEIEVNIPKNYENYKLYLTTKDNFNGYVTQSFSTLNTKLDSE